MNWKQVLTNIGITFGLAFVGGYSASGKVSVGVGAGVAAVTGNQVGLFQAPPHADQR